MQWMIYAAYGVLLAAGMLLFATARRRVAMLVVLIAGWLALPVTELVPLHTVGATKTLGIGATILLGTVIFARRMRWPRGSWADMAMLVWIAVPGLSELSNGLGFNSATRVWLSQAIVWGLPYFIGRLYITDSLAVEELALAIVWGAAAMMVPAMYETVFRPPLHRLVYGVYGFTNDALTPMILNKWGPLSYRPVVMLHEGALAVSFYFAAAAIIFTWLILTRHRFLKRRWLEWILLTVLLLLTPLVCKPFVGIIVMVLGVVVLGVSALLKTRWLLVAVMLAPAGYVGLRVSGVLQSPFIAREDQRPEYLGKNYSLWTRLYAEDRVLEENRKQPWLGFGSTIRREMQNTGIPRLHYIDGLWAFVLARNGWIGLIAAWVALLLPCIHALRLLQGPGLRSATTAPLAALLVVILMHAIDWTMNMMISPVWLVAMGGFVSLATARRRQQQAHKQRAAKRNMFRRKQADAAASAEPAAQPGM